MRIQYVSIIAMISFCLLLSSPTPSYGEDRAPILAVVLVGVVIVPLVFITLVTRRHHRGYDHRRRYHEKAAAFQGGAYGTSRIALSDTSCVDSITPYSYAAH